MASLCLQTLTIGDCEHTQRTVGQWALWPTLDGRESVFGLQASINVRCRVERQVAISENWY